jgi:hypothetical protein
MSTYATLVAPALHRFSLDAISIQTQREADMADADAPESAPVVRTTAIEPRKDAAPAPRAASGVLAGAEVLLDGKTHVALAVQVSSDGKLSTLMIPDVAGADATCFITKPVRIKADKLAAYLQKKNITLPDPVKNLLTDTTISCEAFYSTKDGPFLMMFAIQFDKGLIASLTGDADLGEMFDVKGGSVRVLRCPATSFDVLEKYAAELSS